MTIRRKRRRVEARCAQEEFRFSEPGHGSIKFRRYDPDFHRSRRVAALDCQPFPVRRKGTWKIDQPRGLGQALWRSRSVRPHKVITALSLEPRPENKKLSVRRPHR